MCAIFAISWSLPKTFALTDADVPSWLDYQDAVILEPRHGLVRGVIVLVRTAKNRYLAKPPEQRLGSCHPLRTGTGV